MRRHRCRDHADYIGGGWYAWECLICGRHLDRYDIEDNDGDEDESS